MDESEQFAGLGWKEAENPKRDGPRWKTAVTCSLSLPSEVSVAAAGGRRGGEEEGGIVNDQYRVGSLLSWQPTDPSLSLLFHSRRKPTLAVSFHFSRFSFISFLHALGSFKKNKNWKKKKRKKKGKRQSWANITLGGGSSSRRLP